MYGQLSTRDSLNDLIVCIRAHKSKYYHLGFGKNVSKNNLSNSNKNRDYRIYESLANHLVGVAQSNSFPEDEPIENINGPVYAIDSSVIDLCLNVFWWAIFRKEKGGIKMHTLFDIKTNIPTFIYVSEALLHDVHFLDIINFEMGSYYVFDKAYIDFCSRNNFEFCVSFHSCHKCCSGNCHAVKTIKIKYYQKTVQNL